MADPLKRKREDDYDDEQQHPLKRFEKSAYERDKDEREEKEQEELTARRSVLEAFRQEHGDDDDEAAYLPAHPSGRRHFLPRPAPPKESLPKSWDDVDKVWTVRRNAFIKTYRKQQARGPPSLLRLFLLPLETTREEVEEFLNTSLPAPLSVKDIQLIDHSIPKNPGNMSQPLLSALVSTDDGTTHVELTNAERILQGKYFGKGHFIRAALTYEEDAYIPSQYQKEPFGAQYTTPAGPPHLQSARPPPPSLQSSIPYASQNSLSDRYEVVVEPPTDIDQINLIHMTVERVLTAGFEFEEKLMDQKEVQKDPAWSWLWDDTSIGGRWYRWQLWKHGALGIPTEDILEPEDIHERNVIFEDSATWKKPEAFRFEYCATLEDIQDDPDADMIKSDDDEQEPELDEDDKAEYLGPYQYALLQYHLDNLPNNPALLTEKSLKYVVAHALDNANKAVNEIALRLVLYLDMAYNRAITNITPNSTSSNGKGKGKAVDSSHFKTHQCGGNCKHHTVTADQETTGRTPSAPPEATTDDNMSESVATDTQFTSEGTSGGDFPAGDDYNQFDDDYAPYESMEEDEDEPKPPHERWPNAKPVEDPSGPILVALYVLTDVMDQAKDEGGSTKMRFAGLFEEMLENRDMFANLGRLARDLNWGRIRADRWQKQVMGILEHWQVINSMKKDAVEQFKHDFINPRSTQEERKLIEEAKKDSRSAEEVFKSKFKPIGQQAAAENMDTDVKAKEETPGESMAPADIEGERMSVDIAGKPTSEDIDGEPMTPSDIDGEPMTEDDIDGEPMTDDEADGQPMSEDEGIEGRGFAMTGATNGANTVPTGNGTGIVDEQITRGIMEGTRESGVHNGGPSNDDRAEEAVRAAVRKDAGGIHQRGTREELGGGSMSSAVGTAAQKAPAGKISFSINKPAAKANVKPKALGGPFSEESD